MASILESKGLFPVVPMKEAGGAWEVVGEISNILHVVLKPGQVIQAEPGTMIYGSNKMKAEVRMGGIGRLLTQGNFIKLNYTNSDSADGYVGLASNFPGQIVPYNLDNLGGSMAFKHDCFLGAMDKDARIDMFPLQADSVMACCCAGIPFFMERISGKGWIFIAAHGTIMQKQLLAGEEICVDTAAVVAVATTVRVDVKMTGGCSTMCCGGEGLFNTTLKGPGLVVLTSMSIEKIRRLFPAPAPVKKEKDMGD